MAASVWSRAATYVSLFRVVVVAILIPIVAAVFVVDYVTPYITPMAGEAQATVLAAVVPLLGVVFTAAYGEISGYYKAAAASRQKKWEMVFPLVKKHYIPWINVAEVLERSINEAKSGETADARVSQSLVLFHLMLFYGHRLRFILEDGGLILLMHKRDDEVVLAKYRRVEEVLLWVDNPVEQRRVASELQARFLAKDKPGAPYVFDDFRKDVEIFEDLRKMRDQVGAWLAKVAAVENATKALSEFHETFEDRIDNLYSAW